MGHQWSPLCSKHEAQQWCSQESGRASVCVSALTAEGQRWHDACSVQGADAGDSDPGSVEDRHADGGVCVCVCACVETTHM